MKSFPSFQRQLNLYGFGRIREGEDKGAYFHELFLKGKQHLVTMILRQSQSHPKPTTSSSRHQMMLTGAVPKVATPSTLEKDVSTTSSSSYKTPSQAACTANTIISQSMSLRSVVSGNNVNRPSWTVNLQQKQPQQVQEEQCLDLQPIFDYFLRGPDAFDLPSNEVPALRSLPLTEDYHHQQGCPMDLEPFHLP